MQNQQLSYYLNAVSQNLRNSNNNQIDQQYVTVYNQYQLQSEAPTRDSEMVQIKTEQQLEEMIKKILSRMISDNATPLGEKFQKMDVRFDKQKQRVNKQIQRLNNILTIQQSANTVRQMRMKSYQMRIKSSQTRMQSYQYRIKQCQEQLKLAAEKRLNQLNVIKDSYKIRHKQQYKFDQKIQQLKPNDKQLKKNNTNQREVSNKQKLINQKYLKSIQKSQNIIRIYGELTKKKVVISNSQKLIKSSQGQKHSHKRHKSQSKQKIANQQVNIIVQRNDQYLSSSNSSQKVGISSNSNSQQRIQKVEKQLNQIIQQQLKSMPYLKQKLNILMSQCQNYKIPQKISKPASVLLLEDYKSTKQSPDRSQILQYIYTALKLLNIQIPRALQSRITLSEKLKLLSQNSIKILQKINAKQLFNN